MIAAVQNTVDTVIGYLVGGEHTTVAKDAARDLAQSKRGIDMGGGTFRKGREWVSLLLMLTLPTVCLAQQAGNKSDVELIRAGPAALAAAATRRAPSAWTAAKRCGPL